MKTLFLFLALSVGAWGQTTTLHLHNCHYPSDSDNVVCDEGFFVMHMRQDWGFDAEFVPVEQGTHGTHIVNPSPYIPISCHGEKDCDKKMQAYADTHPQSGDVTFLPTCCDAGGITPIIAPNPSPVDVPAIQVTDDSHIGVCYDMKKRYTENNMCQIPYWSCADKSRTLLETLDGKTHYCHKPQLTGEK